MTGVRYSEAAYIAMCRETGRTPEPSTTAPGKTEARRVVDTEMRRRLENRFAAMWEQMGGPTDYVRNLRFDEPDSRMEFDFAWPALRCAVEVNGGQWKGSKSGHGSVRGLERDAEKVNAAARRGWRLLVLTSSMVTWEGVAQVLEQMREAQRAAR